MKELINDRTFERKDVFMETFANCEVRQVGF